MLKETAICILALIVFFSGCTTTLPEKTGSVSITSSPSAAEIYLDNEYHGTTPAMINAISAGNHTIEIRAGGYETWSSSIRIDVGSTLNVSTSLKSTAPPLPTTVPVLMPTMTKKAVPEIHVDGYWTYPALRSYTSPVPLLVHAEGANVGPADAREVTTSANLYYNDQQLCWVKLYFGTIKSGGHATKDTMMFCSLPAGASDYELAIKFENVVVNP